MAPAPEVVSWAEAVEQDSKFFISRLQEYLRELSRFSHLECNRLTKRVISV